MQKTILVVDDEELLLVITASLIESFGYTVRSAGSAQAAVELLSSGEPIDLLFTDIRLVGGLNGLELAKWAVDLRPDLPVIYTTGFMDLAALDDGNVVGPVLGKPCEPDLLSLTIKETLTAAPVRS